MKLPGPIPLAKAVDPAERRAQQDRQLREAAQMYEQHFLGEMVKSMRATVPDEGGMIQTSFAEKIFRDQLDHQNVEGWAKRGGVGLADIIYKNVKDRYLPDVPPGGVEKPKGPLPLQPKPDGESPFMIMEKANPRKLDTSWIFNGPAGLESGEREVRAPFSGRVSQAFTDENGRQLVRIQHQLGMESSLYFAGKLDGVEPRQDVEAGRKLGVLNQDAPSLNWRLTRG